MTSVTLKPVLQPVEFDGSWLAQCAIGKAPNPVVVDAQSFRNLPVLTRSLPDGLPGSLDSFLDFRQIFLPRGVDIIVVTCYYNSTRQEDRQPENDMANTIKELMARFDEYRAKWIAESGSDEGFNDWFTTQVGG